MRKLISGALIAIIIGCSSGATVPAPRPMHSSVLLRAEIDAFRYRDAYDMIERLRPDFLRRDREARVGTLVVVDFTILGSVETLRGFPAGAVRRVSRLNAAECEMRFGSRRSMPSGAIWIETLQ